MIVSPTPARRRRAMALFIVLGVLAVLVIYGVTAQISVMGSLDQSRNTRRTLARELDREELLNRASARLAGSGAAQPAAIWAAASGAQARVGIAPAPAGALPAGLRSEPGDLMVTLAWQMPPALVERVLLNRENRRLGPVRLPDEAAPATSPTETVAP